MPRTAKKRGPRPLYESKDEKYEARKARQRERYQQKRAGQFQNTFQLALGPVPTQNAAQPENHIPPNQPSFYYENRLQIDDDFGYLLPPSPPQSPSLGSASMDISEPESDELNIENPPIRQSDAEFEDIDMLVPDLISDDQSAVAKLAVRLADQLLEFHGCCNDCHNRSKMEHTSEHNTHTSLQDYVTDSATINCPQVLGTFGIAAHKDDLASQMTAAEKRQVYSGISPNDLDEMPLYICLIEGDTLTEAPEVSFDVDSILGFPTSLGFARWGICWNPTQMQVSDL